MLASFLLVLNRRGPGCPVLHWHAFSLVIDPIVPCAYVPSRYTFLIGVCVYRKGVLCNNVFAFFR
jgi:hypothetical protein